MIVAHFDRFKCLFWAMDRQPRKLRELFELHTEAEALRLQVPESEALAQRYSRSKKWMGAANEILRRTSSRGRAGLPKLSVSDVEDLLGMRTVESKSHCLTRARTEPVPTSAPMIHRRGGE